MTTAQDLLRKDYATTDVKDTVSQLLGIFKKSKERAALVFDGKKYLGVVSKRFLLTSRIDTNTMKVGNLVKKRSKAKTPFYVPVLTPETDIKQICKLMAGADAHLLPIMKKDQLIGVVHVEDVLAEIAKEYKAVDCDALMNTPITARAEEGIDQIINVFSRASIDHLPIIDAQNRIAGMVAMSDFLENPNFWGASAQKISQAASHQQGKRTGYAHGEKTGMTHLPIKNCMSRKPLCCTPPETKISAAIALMAENNVCSIVLVKYDKPVGIMTAKDILLDYAK